MAERFDLPVEVFAAANQLEPPYTIFPGQVLKIPLTLIATPGCIAFSSTRANGVCDIWDKNPSQAGSTRLTRNLGGPASVPIWSPTGLQLAFVSPDGTLYVVDAATRASRALIGGLPELTTFAWSPNTNTIAVSINNQIVLIDTATAATNFLTNGDHPAYLPNGQTILFSRTTSDSNQQIFAINIDGTGLRQITAIPNSGFISDLSIDPQGELVAFTRPGPSNFMVNIAEIASGRIFATPPGQEQKDFFPRWSSNVLLAYNSKTTTSAGLRGIIRLVDRQGSLVDDLTDTACFGERIAWSPDGLHIVYPNCLTQYPQLTVVGLHGLPVQITSLGINVHPNWKTGACPP